MSEPTRDELSSHTVAELKVMCKENGLIVSGRKADLIARLDEHFNEESISLEEPISVEKEESLSLEDEDLAIEEAEMVPLPVENEVFEAEILEAEVIEEEVEFVPVFSKSGSSSATLMDQIKNPKVAAILLTILLATGGWYWSDS